MICLVFGSTACSCTMVEGNESKSGSPSTIMSLSSNALDFLLRRRSSVSGSEPTSVVTQFFILLSGGLVAQHHATLPRRSFFHDIHLWATSTAAIPAPSSLVRAALLFLQRGIPPAITP